MTLLTDTTLRRNRSSSEKPTTFVALDSHCFTNVPPMPFSNVSPNPFNVDHVVERWNHYKVNPSSSERRNPKITKQVLSYLSHPDPKYRTFILNPFHTIMNSRLFTSFSALLALFLPHLARADCIPDYPGCLGQPGCVYVVASDMGPAANCSFDYCNCGGISAPLLLSISEATWGCNYTTQPTADDCPTGPPF